MTEDTYGGKTPQETLDLFVAALKAEDVDLASKYFMLDDSLSREEWLNTLVKFKEEELLDNMVEDIEGKAKEDKEGKTDEKGEVTFDNVSPGEHGLVIKYDGKARADKIQVIESEQLQDLDNLMTILESVDYSVQIEQDNDQT